MASSGNSSSMSVVDESTIVTDESDSQTVHQSSTASSTTSTAVPQRPTFGTGLCYDPNQFPPYEKAPDSFIKKLEKFFSDKIDAFKDVYKAFLRKQATYDSARGHLANETFPSDLCHKFVSVAQFAQTIPQDRRDEAHEADRAAFHLFKIEVMKRRLPLYEFDVNNALAIVNSFKNQEKVQADFLTATSANYVQFQPAISWHFVEYLGRVEEVEKSFKAHHLKIAENLAIAKQASLAKHAAKTAASAAGATDFDAGVAAAAAAAVSGEKGDPNPFAQFDSVMLADLFRRVMILTSGVSGSPSTSSSSSTAAPAATFAQAAAKPASNKPASNKPAFNKSTFAGQAAATKVNTAQNASNSGKGPKNSSGSGGRPTNERQGRPKDERRYENDRRHDDRSQYRQSGSTPSSRSDTSRNKRQHSPSPDRDDSRSRSRPRQSRSRRSRSRSPRRDRDDDSGRGRSQARNSSRRDSRERDSAPSKR